MSTPGAFGNRIGLIGDVHGNREFLETAVVELAAMGATSVLQLGDFGMTWAGGKRERLRLDLVNEVLSLVDLTMWVVLGNHENYDLIDGIEPDAAGVRWMDRVGLLPRAGRLNEAGVEIGWLSGAASVDRSRREPGRSWWPQEIPSDHEVLPLRAGPPVDVLFAHEALDTSLLRAVIAPNATGWEPADLTYATAARQQFTQRTAEVLGDGGLVVSGHYHCSLRAEERIPRLGGSPIRARNVILGSEWQTNSIALLRLPERQVDLHTARQTERRQRERAFRLTLQARPELRERIRVAYQLNQLTFDRMVNGHIAVPLHLSEALHRWALENSNGTS